MNTIEQIDKNFSAASIAPEDDVVWHDIRQAPFQMYGHAREGCFQRLPAHVAEGCDSGVKTLCKHTAGIRGRFKTDSPYVALKVFVPDMMLMNHMSLSGSGGFDLFTQKNGVFTFQGKLFPPYGPKEFDGKIPLSGQVSDCILSFPLYNAVEAVYVGIKRGCSLTAGEEYAIRQPIVFYGSSITQGGCASRPSTTYQAYISHRFNADFRNLGFSGSAKGEPIMAEYIASLSMSAFVMDYDYNAPDAAHLQATHYPFYKTVRKAHPDIPILMVSRASGPDGGRRAVIQESCRRAMQEGDTQVRFVDGSSLYGADAPYCTVDGVHPNDLGFYKMGKLIGDALAEYFISSPVPPVEIL